MNLSQREFPQTFILLIALSDIIYDFEVRAKQSSIPNAGNGAFLTFLGARELKPSRLRRGDEIMEDRRYKPLPLSQPMEAVHPDGFGISFKVVGEDLCAPYRANHQL